MKYEALVQNVGARYRDFACKLNLMLAISTDANQLDFELATDMRIVMKNEKKQRVLNKLPELMRIKKDPVRHYFFHRIDTNNEIQEDINKLSKEIRAELAVDTPNTYSPDFDAIFAGWSNSKYNKTHKLLIKGNIKTMKSNLGKYNFHFNNLLGEIIRLRNDVDDIMRGVIRLYDGFLKDDYSFKGSNIVVRSLADLIKKLDDETALLYHEQNKLYEKLGVIKLLLENYNKQRALWAEFLMGKPLRIL